MKLKNIVRALIIGIVAFAIFSCEKENNSALLSVQMTDDAGDYDSVNVEIIGLQIHYSNQENGENGWLDLETETGNYDLLILQDGVTTILTEEEEVPVGEMQQLRLLLGTNNYIIIDGEKHPLELSSQDDEGIKLNLNAVVNDADEIEVLFDFNADKSIILTGNGKYKLKPVINLEEVVYL